MKKLKKRLAKVRALLRINARNYSRTQKQIRQLKDELEATRRKRENILKRLDRARRAPVRDEELIERLQVEVQALHEDAEDIRALLKQRRTRRSEIEANRKRALERRTRIRRRLRKIRAQRQPSLTRVKVVRKPGDPHWGGAGDLMREIERFMVRRQGLPLGSGKRTPAHNAAIGGSPNSDHLTTKTYADARDFPTYDGEAAARALARWLGIKGWQPNSYASHTVIVDGVPIRVQILWGAAIAHGDHVHVGASV